MILVWEGVRLRGQQKKGEERGGLIPIAQGEREWGQGD